MRNKYKRYNNLNNYNKCFEQLVFKSLDSHDTHVITHRFEVESDPSIDYIPDVENECIRTVEKYKDLKDTLKNFTRSNKKYIKLSKSAETGLFISDKNVNPEEALATINVYQYTHLDDTDVMVKLVSVELNQFAILCMAFPDTLNGPTCFGPQFYIQLVNRPHFGT